MKTFKKIQLLILGILFSFNAFAQQDDALVKLNQKHNLIEDGFGAQGYDVVAYFTKSKAQKGNSKYQHKFHGITYRFKTEENLNLFKANPSKYEPAYGGWCAYAVAEKGIKMEPDADSFRIQNGKLYFFYDGFFNNTIKIWEEAPKEYKVKGDKNWKKIIK